MRLALAAALGGLLAMPAAAAADAVPGVGDDAAALRAAYSLGFWDGFAEARSQPMRARGGRAAIALSSDAPGAPVWLVGPSRDGAASTGLPAFFASGEAQKAIYFKGPWIWTDDDASDYVRAGAGVDLDLLDRNVDLVETREVPGAAAEAVRKLRAMGINEGVILVGEN